MFHKKLIEARRVEIMMLGNLKSVQQNGWSDLHNRALPRLPL